MRMMFSGLYFMGEVPFDTVFIHGIVRDSDGRKMSKSLGNGVDPLETIDQYGADALRFMLITGNAPGSDIRFFPERVEASRNFANKLWNASRFVLMNIDFDLIKKYEDSNNYSLADQWILSKVNQLVREVTENFERFELGIALSKVYDFIWNELCDWYIELIKPVFYHGTDEEKGVSYRVIKDVLITSLKVLHPTMPFITEEIYSFLKDEKTIMKAPWPIVNESLINEQIEDSMGGVIEAIKSIRNLRQEMNVPNKRRSTLYIFPNKGKKESFEASKEYLIKLAYADDVVFITEDPKDEQNVSLVTSSAKLYIPLLDLVDKEKEIARLEKEEKRLDSEILRVDKKLGNGKFLANAKEDII